MKQISLLLTTLLLTLFAYTQNNLLLLQKRGRTEETFFPGKYISIQTRQGGYADGILTRVQQDSIYIRHFVIQQSVTPLGGIVFDTAYQNITPVHWKDIGAIVKAQNARHKKKNGTLLMIAGGGVLALGVVNGIYRGDPAKEWFKPSGYITAGALMGLGLLAKRSSVQKKTLGKKYSIKILPLDKR